MTVTAYAVYADDIRDPELSHSRPLLRVEPTKKGNVTAFTKKQARKFAEAYKETYIVAQTLTEKGSFNLQVTHVCSPTQCRKL